jgi:hypothetical protein
MTWAGHVARRVLLQRPRRRWEDNIRMDLMEMGWDDADCIQLAQDRDRWRSVVDMVMSFSVA